MLTVDLRDPMVNRFNSNMTQEVSGWGPAEDQLLLSLVPTEAWPPPPTVGYLCSAVVVVLVS